MVQNQEVDIFSFTTPRFKIDKKIRLIELFAGIGAQARSLELLGANFEHHRAVEFDKYAIASYNAVHGTNFETSDVTKIHASDLGIEERERNTATSSHIPSRVRIYRMRGKDVGCRRAPAHVPVSYGKSKGFLMSAKGISHKFS